MDNKLAYLQLLKGLAAQIHGSPFASEEEEDAITAKRLLQPGSDAPSLFTEPINDWTAAVFKELEIKAFRNTRYARPLYGEADDIDLADAIADLAFAQLHRKPIERRAKSSGEYESGVAFVLGIYLVFALLLRGKGVGDFDRFFSLARTNYYLNLGSRTIRQLYDKNWSAKYTPRHNLYPLG